MGDSDLGGLLARMPTSTYDKAELVTLLVGPDAHPIAVHESVIIRSSEFFKTALKKEWAEGQTRTVKLPDESKQIMSFYITFCYSKELPTRVLTSTVPDDFLDDEFEQCWSALANLYILGDRFLDKELQHTVVREILRVNSLKDEDGECSFPTNQNVAIIYNGTTAESPARRLMVDLHVAYGLEKCVENFNCPQFLFDLSRALLASISGSEGRTCRGQELFAQDYYV